VERTGVEYSGGRAAVRSLQVAVEAIVEPVFLVGGSVRDLLMERSCEDYDFATSRTPDEVEEAVRAAGRRPYLTGKRFGTIGFKVAGHTVEVTTFRAETYPDASRRPEVRYLDDLGDDLARRDFTINAMALHGDALIDPHGGRADIAARTVRAVGDPSARFEEDPLRLLRAARFASQLDFEVEPGTQLGMVANAHRILSVARERRASELDKLLVGPSAVAGLRLLSETGLLRYLLPEVQPLAEGAGGSLWERALAAVSAAPAEPAARWAALLRDVAAPYLDPAGASSEVRAALGAEIADRIGLGLRWSTARRETVREAVRRG
jgi:tRNA nucleotidyltransferase/poly(A) polymerase